MDDADALIVTDGLAKRYRDFWGRARVEALRGLTLDVRRGEVFGVLGPNGSGKTTTIKLLLGLIRPTAGRARVFGRPPDDVAAKARLGFLPEESYFHRFLTGEETLRFYGKLFPLPRATLARRIDELLELVDLREARGRRLHEYSKGMVRRIGLAQALINDPELLILDEPTSGLDPMGQADVKALIQRLAGAGKTVLLASHLLADVQDLCDRVAILHRGELRALDTVAALVAAPDTGVTLEVEGATGPDDPRLAALDEAAKAAGLCITARRGRRLSLETVFLRIVRGAVEQGQGARGKGQGEGEISHGEGSRFLASLEMTTHAEPDPDR